MAGYFSNLFNSFKPGGLKPWEALLGAFDQQGNGITSGDYSPHGWYDVLPGSTSSDKVLGDDAGSVITNENNSSAEKSADVANQQTSDWFNDAMNYNAEQARLDREFQQTSADKAMKFEAEEAQKLRDWQEIMSNTQYQRAVADLKKAGLNPILLAQSLSGASTPSGTSASGISASGSRASVSQSSAVKAEVDLNSRAKIIEAYLRSETSLKRSEIQSISNLLSALIGLGR